MASVRFDIELEFVHDSNLLVEYTPESYLPNDLGMSIIYFDSFFNDMGAYKTDMFFEKYGADHLTVPIPSKRPRWKPTGCEESKLVDLPC